MSENSNDGDVTASRSQPDWNQQGITTDGVLDFLAAVANDSGFEMSLTLTVPGGTVTGTLIGFVRWLEDTNDALTAASAELGPTLLKSWLEDEQAYQENYREHSEDEGFKDRPIHFIHLRNARFLGGYGFLPGPDHPGMLWRGRIDQVSSWTAGGMNPG